MNIEDISKTHAIVEIDGLWVSLTLDSDCERIRADDCQRAFSYLQYTPIILDMQWLDGTPIPDEIRKSLDCDAFYDAYQALFDDEFAWGESVAGWY